MNEKVANLLKNIPDSTLTNVASRVLNDSSVVSTSDTSFDEITTSHNDRRTIGIVKVSGNAATGQGSKPWSSVVKAIDPNVELDEGDAARWVSIDIELLVYEKKLFGNDGDLFRPAHSYRVETTEDGLRVLWLEDLSSAVQPPWELNNYLDVANHLGSFNGRYHDSIASLPFAVPDDMYFRRWGVNEFEQRAIELQEKRDSTAVRESFRDTPVESALEFASLANRVFETARSVTHGLVFGDSHARNMFPGEEQTVGIDWAGMGNEPIGVDIGVLIGSGMSFGVKEAQMVIPAERDIFESYVKGLRTAGWDGDMNHLRIGFFAQFAGYMLAISTASANLSIYEGDRREWIEKRFGVPLDEIPSQLAPAISLLPKYAEELKQLLN